MPESRMFCLVLKNALTNQKMSNVLNMWNYGIQSPMIINLTNLYLKSQSSGIFVHFLIDQKHLKQIKLKIISQKMDVSIMLFEMENKINLIFVDVILFIK